MTATAFLSVAPTIEGSMAPEVAKAIDALEAYDVEYETTPIGTVIEAEEASLVFEAARAAHEAVDADRVGTFLKIDDKRRADHAAARKVESVEKQLGRQATSRRE